LMAVNEEKMRSMMESLEKYLGREKLDLNERRTKIMRFRRKGERMVKKN